MLGKKSKNTPEIEFLELAKRLVQWYVLFWCFIVAFIILQKLHVLEIKTVNLVLKVKAEMPLAN